jgi:phosphate acyltransferase
MGLRARRGIGGMGGAWAGRAGMSGRTAPGWTKGQAPAEVAGARGQPAQPVNLSADAGSSRKCAAPGTRSATPSYDVPVVRVALDAMGGDHAPRAPVEGAVAAARAWGYEVQLVGRAADVRAALATQPLAGLESLLPVVDAPEVIEMGEHPAAAVRAKRRSSMAVGVERVKNGLADCFVSAGNTGGVLATALLGLRRIPGITSERPALAALVPTLDGACVLLDVGANADVKPDWLAEFALMGSVYAQIVLGKPEPSVATLSNGEEEGKGNALLAAAVPLIRALPIRYVGNVEGNEVTGGAADVAVVDGFAGNIYLKGAEGVVATMTELIRRELTASWPRKLLAAGLRPAFRSIRRRLSYEEYGGVPLLGVNGVVIVAHGRSSGYALRNAIRAGARCVEQDLVPRISAGLAASGASTPSAVLGEDAQVEHG